MNEKVEFLFQTLRFTPMWGIIDLLFILHFCISWYRSAKKTGWKIDFWFLTLFISLFQSTLILYPFHASPFNYSSTKECLDNLIPFIDQAFVISLLGYCFIWIGRYTFDITRGRTPFIALAQMMHPFARIVEANIKNKKAFMLITWATAFLGLIILAIQFSHGSFFNGRGFYLKSAYLRPLFNITFSIFPIILSFIALRLIQYKEKENLIMFFFLLIISCFFGVRFIFINGLFYLFTQKIFYNEGRVSLFKLGIGCLFLLLMAVLLENLRQGAYDPLYATSKLFFNFFYGNNFSDVRDFAWILSYWDGEFLYGKSYCAALISFIPRVFSPLREEWSFSMYTNNLLNFDPEVMPGLRPGLFGEPYLNFGLFGVIFFGWIFGFYLRYTDHQIKKNITISKDLIKGYSLSITFYLLQCLIISASMWMFYVFILINLATIPFRQKNPQIPSL